MGYYTVLVHWEDPPRKVEYKIPHNRNGRNFIVAFYYSFEIGGQADPWAPTLLVARRCQGGNQKKCMTPGHASVKASKKPHRHCLFAGLGDQLHTSLVKQKSK